jgi:hypothetical protein
MDAETLADQKAKFYLDRFGSVHPSDENVREFLDDVFGVEHSRKRLRIRRHRGRAYIVDIDTDCILGSGPNSADAAIEADAKFKQTLSGTTPGNPPPTESKTMIQAKMYVSKLAVTDNCDEVQMHAVYSDDPTSPNYSFSQATPSASVNLIITNPSARGIFREGQEYLINFEEAPEPLPAANPAAPAPSGNASDPLAPTPGPTPAEQVTAASTLAANQSDPVPASD